MLNSFSKRATAFLSDLLPGVVHHPVVEHLARFVNRNIRFSKDILIEVHGLKMYANTLDRLTALVLWRRNILEDSETNLLKNIIKEGMVIVDIGSNLGYFALHTSKLVGPTGKVYAFEPDPNNFRLLCKNIAANDCRNVTAVPMAVSSYTGKAKLFRSEGHSGDHRLFDSKDGRPSIDVDAVRLDDYFGNGQPIHFLKMDIQGAEYGALLGMPHIAHRKDLTVLIEFMPVLLRKNGTEPKQFLDKIKEFGFAIYLMNEKTGSVELTDTDTLEAKYQGHRYANLLLKKID